MTEEQSPPPVSRREFLKTSTLVVTGSAIVFGAVSVPLLKRDRLLLRPPGALAEDTFLASCIKCGQCLQVCPPQILKLAGISEGFGIGTPHLVPRQGACILCSGLPCVLACPTGALDHHLSLGKDAKMGLAVLTSPATCLAIQGVNDLVYRLENLKKKGTPTAIHAEFKEILTTLLQRLTDEEKTVWQQRFSLQEISDATLPVMQQRMGDEDLAWLTGFAKSSQQAHQACRICLDACPIKEQNPISFVAQVQPDTGRNIFRPTVNATCVGCGVCEQKCPAPTAAITIAPRLRWSEKLTAHHTGEQHA